MQACRICKGESKERCMFCGQKKKGKKPFFGAKKPQLTNAQIVARDGKREATMELNRFSHNSIKFGNCTTELESLDRQIKEHRIFGKKLYARVNIDGKSITSVADEFDLTANQVKLIIATTLFQINQGVADCPNPLRVGPKKPTEAEIAETRRVRDLCKIPKKRSWTDREIVYDEPIPDEIGECVVA